MGYRCRNQLTVIKAGKGEGISWEIDTDTYILLYIKQITNENLLD